MMSINTQIVFESYKKGQIAKGDEYIIADGVRRELHITIVLDVAADGRFAYSGSTKDVPSPPFYKN